MDRNDFVLAVVSSCPDAFYTPVQVQKLLFLIDEKIPEPVEGPYFDFAPYDYGPFDKNVYLALEELESAGYVLIEQSPCLTYRRYTTTKQGQKRGEMLLDSMPLKARGYIKRLSEYVRELSFADLVSAIYRAYPHMRAKSVFRD